MTSKPKKTSLATIARSCGVSKMTVSRALRDDPNVASATKSLVLRAAEKAGFMPCGSRRSSLSASRGYCVLFQQDCSVNDAYFSEIILSIQSELFRHGAGCSLAVINDEYADFVKLNNMMRSNDVNGVIVVGQIPSYFANVLQTNFLNLVFVDYPGDPDIRLPYQAVCTDQLHGAHLAMRHLLRLGRKKIALICGPSDHYFSRDLMQGYKSELANSSIPVDDSLILQGNFHVDSGAAAIATLIDKGVDFDAVLTNDEMAQGAIKEMQARGIRIPEDVSVVGFDGLPIGRVITPALTTVVVERAKMGRIAVERLIASDSEGSMLPDTGRISLFPRLIIRESCGSGMNDQIEENGNENNDRREHLLANDKH